MAAAAGALLLLAGLAAAGGLALTLGWEAVGEVGDGSVEPVARSMAVPRPRTGAGGSSFIASTTALTADNGAVNTGPGSVVVTFVG